MHEAVSVTVKIRKDIWNPFAYFCRANRIAVYKGVEAALTDVLDRHGLTPYLPSDGTSEAGVDAADGNARM